METTSLKKPLDKNVFFSPYEYADLCGVAKSTIYKRIEVGTLDVTWTVDNKGKPKQVIDLNSFPPVRRKYLKKIVTK